MPEPVNAEQDWLATRGAKEAVTYRAYRAKTPTTAEGYAADAPCYGVKGPPRVERREGLPVVAVTWALAGLTARPTLRSLVVDGAGTSYRIDAVSGYGPFDAETIVV